MAKKIVFAGAALAATAAFGVLPCRFLHEMTGEYVTPHHSFRGSDAEKPLKVLFLLDRTVLPSAVSIAAGQNGVIRYTLKTTLGA